MDVSERRKDSTPVCSNDSCISDLIDIAITNLGDASEPLRAMEKRCIEMLNIINPYRNPDNPHIDHIFSKVEAIYGLAIAATEYNDNDFFNVIDYSFLSHGSSADNLRSFLSDSYTNGVGNHMIGVGMYISSLRRSIDGYCKSGNLCIEHQSMCDYLEETLLELEEHASEVENQKIKMNLMMREHPSFKENISPYDLLNLAYNFHRTKKNGNSLKPIYLDSGSVSPNLRINPDPLAFVLEECIEAMRSTNEEGIPNKCSEPFYVSISSIDDSVEYSFFSDAEEIMGFISTQKEKIVDFYGGKIIPFSEGIHGFKGLKLYIPLNPAFH